MYFNFLSPKNEQCDMVFYKYNICFVGIMLGISNMVTVVPGFVSPVIVGYLTYENVSRKFTLFIY